MYGRASVPAPPLAPRGYLKCAVAPRGASTAARTLIFSSIQSQLSKASPQFFGYGFGAAFGHHRYVIAGRLMDSHRLGRQPIPAPGFFLEEGRQLGIGYAIVSLTRLDQHDRDV